MRFRFSDFGSEARIDVKATATSMSESSPRNGRATSVPRTGHGMDEIKLVSVSASIPNSNHSQL